MKRLKRLERTGGLGRLKTLSGRRKKDKFAIPELKNIKPLGGPDDMEQWIASVYQDKRLAARVRKLKDEFPSGYIPELVVYDWLRWNHIEFVYQVSLYGGRQRAGGIVPDFLLLGSYKGRVLQIQGIYWHSTPSRQARDVITKLRLLKSSWQGVKITSVVNVYERDLRIPGIRDRVIQDAVNGIEMPGD